VIWGGEFGRLPIAQLPPDKDEKAGRDHNKNAFALAGRWRRERGTTYGATDDLGLAAVVRNRVRFRTGMPRCLTCLACDMTNCSSMSTGLKEKTNRRERSPNRGENISMKKPNQVTFALLTCGLGFKWQPASATAAEPPENPIFPKGAELESSSHPSGQLNSGLTEGPAVAPDGSIYFTTCHSAKTMA
jgi:hypothetical protein